MQRASRLDTETLIQECRNGYDVSKLKQRIKELEMLLQLRNKELQTMAKQLSNSKEQSCSKMITLEELVSKLQKECADLRVSVVRSKRNESQKMELQIRKVRKDCQQLIEDCQQRHLTAYKVLQEKYLSQIKRNQAKSTQQSEFNKNEVSANNSIAQQKIITLDTINKQLQLEKAQLIASKRQSEKKYSILRQGYDRMKAQYQKDNYKKQEMIAELKAELDAQKLKNNLITERIQQENEKRGWNSKAKNEQLQQLLIKKQRLQIQNERFRKQLEQKNEEILNLLEERAIIHEQASFKPQIIRQCDHLGLISQLQRALQLKKNECSQLANTLKHWAVKIGFDQPLSNRLERIFDKVDSAQKLKDSQSKALKQRVSNSVYFKSKR